MCLHAHTHWLKSCAAAYLPSCDPSGPDAASWVLADGAVSGLWSRRGKKQTVVLQMYEMASAVEGCKTGANYAS